MGNPPHSPLSHLSHTLIMAVEQKQEEETPMTRMQMIITGAGALVAAPILLFLFAWMVAQCHANKPSDDSDKLSWKKVIVPLLACGCTKRDGRDWESAEVSTKKIMMYSIMMYFFAVVGAFVLIMALTSSDEEESENKDVEAGKSPEV